MDELRASHPGVDGDFDHVPEPDNASPIVFLDAVLVVVLYGDVNLIHLFPTEPLGLVRARFSRAGYTFEWIFAEIAALQAPAEERIQPGIVIPVRPPCLVVHPLVPVVGGDLIEVYAPSKRIT